MPGSRSRRPRIVDLLRPASFGADPSGPRLERIRRSPNYADGQFRNTVPTRTMLPGAAKKMIKASLRRGDRALRAPSGPVPLHRPTAADWSRPPVTGLRLTWMGHSSVFTEIDGARILFDPVWGERCSPFGFAGPRRLHPVPAPLADLGRVDAVVISHDHYDHLDMPTIRALAGTGTVFAVPLGVGAHLEHWGVPADEIVELDWHDATRVAGVTLTATPARHFCGRGLRNGQHTLWASWVAAGPEHRVFHSGDTGYFAGFAEIGNEYGPFDATMIQIGAYSEFWPEIHMTPEQGVRTHVDLSRGVPHGALLPIHWGTFNLAPHPWAEPVDLTTQAGAAAGVRVATPRPGQPFEPTHALPEEQWWRAVDARAGRPRAAAENTAAAAPVSRPAEAGHTSDAPAPETSQTAGA